MANRKRNTKRTQINKKIEETNIEKVKTNYKLDIIMAVLIGFSIFIFIGNMEIGGIIGNFISNLLFGIFGIINYILPIVIILSAVFYFINKEKNDTKIKLILFFVLFILLSMLVELILHNNELIGPINAYRIGFSKHIGGGFIGGALVEAFVSLMGLLGAYLLCLILMLITLIFAFSFSPFNMIKNMILSIKKNREIKKQKEKEKKDIALKDNKGNKDNSNNNYEENKINDKTDSDVENLSTNIDNTDKIDNNFEYPYKVSFSINKRKSRINSNIHPGRKKVDDNIDLDIEKMMNIGLDDDLDNKSTSKKRMDKVIRGTSFDTKIAPIYSNTSLHSDEMNEVNKDMLDNYINTNDSYSNISKNGISSQNDNKESDDIRIYNLSPKKETWQDLWKKDIENKEIENKDIGNKDNVNLSQSNIEDIEGKSNSDIEEIEKNVENETNIFNTNLNKDDETYHIKRYIDNYEENNTSLSSENNISNKDNIINHENNHDNAYVDRVEEVEEIQEVENVEKVEEEYIFPPIDILTKNENSNIENLDQKLEDTSNKLETILKNFGVNVKVTGVSRGPSVTRYEILPEMGVKVSKIVNLSDDIKMNLAATDIRIEAPIPGKTAIGIEVPNINKSMVGFREILSSSEFKEEKSKISFALGLDLSGKTVVSDIEVMPHLLIAGATGSGKSVCINTIIMSILYKAKPSEVRFIMIDPKVVELSVYNGIPHLLIPVVTEPKKAAGALRWVVNEMMNRYKLFAEAKVRDINSYNSKIIDGKISNTINGEEVFISVKKLPKIVVIVDELADLMMVAAKDVEESICRLAQLARAAGIHLIIATQRPSVNVITGLIKANMPSRIAFSVTSGIDSRTILDTVGAERLLGKGDMLYHPQSKVKPIRVQGAYVTDKDVSSVTRFIKEHNKVNDSDKEHEEILKEVDSSIDNNTYTEINSSSFKNERDEYFYDAARLLIEKEKGSIGMLQRNFKIGFNRAARIIDELEEFGVVGPEVGTKPRKILVTLEEFENMIN